MHLVPSSGHNKPSTSASIVTSASTATSASIATSASHQPLTPTSSDQLISATRVPLTLGNISVTSTLATSVPSTLANSVPSMLTQLDPSASISSSQGDILFSNEALEAYSDVNSLLTSSSKSSLNLSAANDHANPLSEPVLSSSTSFSNLSSSINSTMDISSEDELGNI